MNIVGHHRQTRTALVTGAGAVVAVLMLAGGEASADCESPTLASESDAAVDRGTQMTVAGTGWGDNCYDTGPPPDGQGVLGVPAADIEVAFVQGELHVVVARGAADSHYKFQVRVTVPGELRAGDAQIVARSSQGQASHVVGAAVLIADTPTASSSGPPVQFGPRSDEAAGPLARENDMRNRWLIGGVLVVGGLIVTAVALRRRSRSM